MTGCCSSMAEHWQLCVLSLMSGDCWPFTSVFDVSLLDVRQQVLCSPVSWFLSQSWRLLSCCRICFHSNYKIYMYYCSLILRQVYTQSICVVFGSLRQGIFSLTSLLFEDSTWLVWKLFHVCSLASRLS